MSNHRLSLAQQIAELDEPTPVDVDPEDDRRGSPAPYEGAVEAREHYLEVGPSSLRRQQDSISDPKYIGVKTSRKQLAEENALGTEDDEEFSGHSDPESRNSASEASSDEDDDDEISSPSEAEDDNEGEEVPPPRTATAAREDNEGLENDLSNVIRKRRDEDRTKGKAVSKQLSLWDSLLDARIRLQKSVTASNRLPPISEFTSHKRCLEAQHALLGEALALVDELSTLRDELIEADEDVQWRPRKRRRVQEGHEEGRRDASAEIDNGDRDYVALIREASEDAAGFEHAYHVHLTHTLAKWSAKVAAVAPSALLPASRKKFSQAGNPAGGVKSVGAQVEELLQNEWPALLARTRLKRGKDARVTLAHGSGVPNADGSGEGAGDQEDVEAFDDTDFYQQLLRDVIDAKGGGGAGRDEDWMASQRQKKAKKTVDTKASKGRKLRYEVHEKMQNFMVPVPLPKGAWHEAQIDELFASLLGKGFEGAGVLDDEMDEDQPTGPELSAEALKGFRVFG
ncbi:apoptosis-antagonizing transcription factor [Gloeopeniophorella convolvens]|nr:apoptosis-antagonizing transcription factor [Gloeopeniophorella convolvens]